MANSDLPWYHAGLNFKCTECGQCCTGSPGYVWVKEDEILEMATFLNLSIEEFSKRYIRKAHGRFSLIEDPKTFDCVFLENKKKCRLYGARPKQCRTFPWWPENLASKASWQETAKRCEGIDHPDAPLIPFTEIESQKNK
jgi:hypothetical protein